LKFHEQAHHFLEQRQLSGVEVFASDLREQHATAVMPEHCRHVRASHEIQESPFMCKEMWNDLQPCGLAFDRHARQAGKIPTAHLPRRGCQSKPALGQERTRPSKVNCRAAGPREGVS
jgi:hypothetical protein